MLLYLIYELILFETEMLCYSDVMHSIAKNFEYKTLNLDLSLSCFCFVLFFAGLEGAYIGGFV